MEHYDLAKKLIWALAVSIFIQIILNTTLILKGYFNCFLLNKE